MKKRIISFVWVMLLCLTVTVPAFASEQARLTDEANLLSEAEASALEEREQTFTAFADSCDSIVTDAKAGKTYKEPFPFARRLGVCFVISLIVAVIAIIAMKGELQSVKKQDAAGAYVKKNSLKVTNSSERFLYKNVDKTEKAQETESKANETTHIGNSGKF